MEGVREEEGDGVFAGGGGVGGGELGAPEFVAQGGDCGGAGCVGDMQ